MTYYNPSIDCKALQKYGKITNPVQYLQEIYKSILDRNGYPYISNARALYREEGVLWSWQTWDYIAYAYTMIGNDIISR